MEPTYKSPCGRVTLYLADCLTVLPTLGKVDACITDPPYGLGTKMRGGTWGAAGKYKDMVDWDVLPSAATIDAIRASADKLVIWGGNYFPLPCVRGWLMWYKQNSLPTMGDFELAWTNLDRPAKAWRGMNGSHDNNHPTEKPVDLMTWCLKQASVEPGQTVLDCYLGSGTTGVAALRHGCNFIGIEISPVYFEIAKRRICAELAQRKMF